MELLKLHYTFNKNVIFKDRGDMLMAYNQESSDMYEFNSVGADIFKLLYSEKDMNEIFKQLNKEYNTKTEDIYDDVKQIIERLIDLKVIIVKEEKNEQ